jgi:hypothetical protein
MKNAYFYSLGTFRVIKKRRFKDGALAPSSALCVGEGEVLFKKYYDANQMCMLVAGCLLLNGSFAMSLLVTETSQAAR